MRKFIEVVNGTATNLIVIEGGAYKNKRYGKSSPDATYIGAGLYPLIEGVKPIYDNAIEALEHTDIVSLDTVTREYHTVPLFTAEELLQEVKTRKLTEIDTAKNEAQQAPVTVRGVQFFGGREAGQKYDEAFRLAQMMGLLVGNFLSADSGMIEVDEPYAIEVVSAVAGATYMLWAKAQEYNAQVNMATTVEEVEAIVWDA